MRDSPVQAPSDATGAHLVLYDGICGLCSRLVQFLLAHDHHAVFNFASLQSATGQADGRACRRRPHQLTTFYVIANYRTPAGLGCLERATPRFSWRASWVAMEDGAALTLLAKSVPRSRLRRRRSKPISRFRAVRTMPDAACGIQKSVRGLTGGCDEDRHSRGSGQVDGRSKKRSRRPGPLSSVEHDARRLMGSFVTLPAAHSS